MYRFVFIVSLLLVSVHPVSADGHSGNKLLEILGEDRNGDAVQQFRTQYILDKTLKNPALGIKLSAGHDSGSVITALTVTAAGYELSDIKYKEFTGVLPFNISMSDDAASLMQKFSITKKPADDDVRLKFKKDSITVTVYFKSASKKKIAYIKFTQNIGAVGPYRSIDVAPVASADVASDAGSAKTKAKPDIHKTAPVAASVSNAKPDHSKAAQAEEPAIKPDQPKTPPVASSVSDAKPGDSKAVMPAEPAVKPDIPKIPPVAVSANDAKPENPIGDNKETASSTVGKTEVIKEKKPDDPFYKSIMSAIESGEEEMFKDIKKDPAQKSNFWNYKYTYSTSISIPGEKYNMLYSFPFQSSQLDFVSVLAETDGPNPSIKTKYTEIEGKLKEDFRSSDGWTYSYTVNPEDPYGLKDLELRNPKLGSIILDYSVNPYGKCVLYLRFLLQYT